MTFAADTGAHIIAEGVETEDELDVLRDLAVRFAQGYHLGRPAGLGTVLTTIDLNAPPASSPMLSERTARSASSGTAPAELAVPLDLLVRDHRGYEPGMPKDRDQQTPANPEDWASLTTHRGQGSGGTGYDRLAGEEAPKPLHDEDSTAEAVPEPLETSDERGEG